MATAKDIAKWMLKRIEEEGYMYQQDVAYEIESLFGEEFIYINDNGNPAISKDVLKEFRKISEDTIVWVRAERMWRLREPGDPPGRQVDY